MILSFDDAALHFSKPSRGYDIRRRRRRHCGLHNYRSHRRHRRRHRRLRRRCRALTPTRRIIFLFDNAMLPPAASSIAAICFRHCRHWHPVFLPLASSIAAIRFRNCRHSLPASKGASHKHFIDAFSSSLFWASPANWKRGYLWLGPDTEFNIASNGFGC